ncbi:MAG: hypothetical protein F9K30_21710 [Dechloromonas sp.]|nr:MAG: hypothetical protein F9K30_21710 [Dechloromonas sp.]
MSRTPRIGFPGSYGPIKIFMGPLETPCLELGLGILGCMWTRGWDPEHGGNVPFMVAAVGLLAAGLMLLIVRTPKSEHGA